MDSLTTASEILAQLKQLSDGMASIRQDVDALKHASSLQGDDPTTPGQGSAGIPSELAPRPSPDDTTDPSYLPSSRIVGTTWAEEMEIRDGTPTVTASTIQVVPVSERTNKFLDNAFSTELDPSERKKLRSHYTLPQNELTKTPFLDTMMANQCSGSTKALDRTLHTIQGRMLEAVGPLSQLLESVNSDEDPPSMDQIGEAVETALTLLANASIHISSVRRAKVLEDYNRELVPFAAEDERDWTSGAPRLFGPNFLKEASEYLQQLHLVSKVKQKPVFQQPPLRSQQGGTKNKQQYRHQPYPRSGAVPKKTYPAGKRSAPKK